jgi:beta-glucosidase
MTEAEQARIAAAVRMAARADVVVAVMGESDAIVGESRSRTSLDLPGRQVDLLRALHATGRPLVVVLMNGRALTINWVQANVPAILEATFPGEFGGNAIADALFGDVNPGGRLPFTVPRSVGQLPMNFPSKPGAQSDEREGGGGEGRRSQVNGVLYPFGHGLSYTTFAYDALRVSPVRRKAGGSVEVSVDVRNTGARAGDEVVQLYLVDLVSSVTTYEKVLRGFSRVTLAPGETKRVVFSLGPRDLQLLDQHQRWVVEPGTFEVQVGSSSTDIRATGRFEIE